MASRRYRHLILSDPGALLPYTYPRQGRGPTLALPSRDRLAHGKKLQDELERVERMLYELRKRRQDVLGIAATERGIYLELQSNPDFELALERLDRRRDGIELVVVQRRNDIMYATLFVAPGKLTNLEKLVTAYIAKDARSGKPKNRKLVESIAELRAATLESFWTDAPELLPQERETSVWWEVWLRAEGDAAAILKDFRTHARGIGLVVRDELLQFPERTVALA